MPFDSNVQSFYNYARHLPSDSGSDSEAPDSSSESGESEYYDAQENTDGSNSTSEYDSDCPGPLNWEFYYANPHLFHSPSGSENESDGSVRSAETEVSESEYDSDCPGPLNWDWYYANNHLYPPFYEQEFESEASEASSTSADNIFGPDGRLTESERNRRRQLRLCFYCGGDHFRVDCEELKAKERRSGNSPAESDSSVGSHGSDGSDNGSEESVY
ncbi:hypothetical protein BT96DRAFT_936014 [Gymnopus androsaceus JB14]|uniref:CCHC-type domain-containing protein n=1 Tax=Gymnopus androsaceus JB14 TaxID=1447944 RepID=A0A6A4I240_9AGAR|nr:hypothetical protein BT96DRAFT_936014 [Gymnopus androsaceus JB14]